MAPIGYGRLIFWRITGRGNGRGDRATSEHEFQSIGSSRWRIIMRGNRGQRLDVDTNVDREPRLPTRRKNDGAPSLNDVRDEWESIVCPECGAEHLDPSTVRVRRVGQEYEARCLSCGAITARYISGVWSA
jgi:predicted RNA-binding Zn-ribbon protein involved in translation (DUF1610 family)